MAAGGPRASTGSCGTPISWSRPGTSPSYWVAYYDMFEHPDPLPPYALGNLDFWWFNPDKAEALKAAGALKQGG